MATANININGNGLNVNVASPRSKIVNTSSPNLTVGKPVVKIPAPVTEQKDILVSILGVLKGAVVADPHQFKYSKELFKTSEELYSFFFEKYLFDKATSSDNLVTITLFERLYNDLTAVSEEQKFNTDKALETEYTYSDEDRYAVIKVVEDSNIIPDELKSFVTKVIYDSGFTTTELKIEITKLFNDTTTSSDIVTTLWKILRVFTELVNTEEELVFDSTKWLLDNYISNDTTYKAIVKSTVDNGSIKDLVKHVTWFRRTYLDNIYATDDVLGEANIDDDQYASVIKGTIDIIDTDDMHTFDMHSRLRTIFSKPSDIINYEISRALPTDNIFNSELVTQLVESLKIDNFYLFEENTIDVDKVINYDSTVITQLVTKLLESIYLDNSFLIDVNTISINKAVDYSLTSITTSDPIFSSIKGLVELQVLSEQLNKEYYKILTPDKFIAQEIVYKEITRPAEDDYFFRQIDVVNLHPNKNIAEIVGTSEVGYMNKQSYFVEDYVIPGYSGTDYTF